MRIDRDGSWFHQNGLIKRFELVSLFSTVLICDEHGQHWLRTPVEFGKIDVVDAPFIIISMSVTGRGRMAEITFCDNLQRDHLLCSKTPLFIEPAKEEGANDRRPYLHLAKGLCAKLSRPVYYQLALLAAPKAYLEDDILAKNALENQTDTQVGTQVGIWSAGTFFALG